MKKEVIVGRKIPNQTVPSRRKQKIRVTKVYFYSLAFLSIWGFLGILILGFFEFDLNIYSEALLMFIIGVALIIESKPRMLKTIRNGFNSHNFPRLVTVTIGVVAIIAGIFSFPGIYFENPVFVAIKGILALLAIIMIIVQTWIIKE